MIRSRCAKTATAQSKQCCPARSWSRSIKSIPIMSLRLGLKTPAEPRPRADAMVTDRPDILLGILTADCVPILFADAEAGVVGAAHSGWKGSLAGVMDETIKAMVKLGAQSGIGLPAQSGRALPRKTTRLMMVFLSASPMQTPPTSVSLWTAKRAITNLT